MSKVNVYQIVTDRIVKQLEAGVVPWRKPWTHRDLRPRNGATRKLYHGVNAMMLGCTPFDSPYWLTFRQAQMWGGHVKKGEQGLPVVFWNFVKREDQDSGEAKTVPFLKYYTVFNVEQCEGLPAKLLEKPAAIDFQPIEACEQIVASLPAGHAQIVHRGNRACYMPAMDMIQMPPRELFSSEQEYYGTLFHELVHSTGHATRLNRKGITDVQPFGSESYSHEELVAELGSAFVCGEAGIDVPGMQQNQAAYLGSWIRKLKGEPRLIVQAAGAAQKAADWLLNAKAEESEREEAMAA